MSGDGNFISPSMWIPHSVTDSILTCFNCWILTKECIHIRTNNAKYTTKYLKLWGLLCILCGTLSQLFRTMSYIPILCKFIYYIANIFSLSQAVILGFYQLSRLYYCFSENTLYSKNGYPQILFRVMFIIGFLLLISYVSFSIVDDNTFSICPNDNTLIPPKSSGSDIQPSWENIIRVIYSLWDFFTLYLYIRKVRMLKESQKKQNQVGKRIESLMNRILIITLFYQICLILSWIISVPLEHYMYDWYQVFGWHLLGAIRTVLFSFSVSLMLEHNTSRYIKFIKFLKRLKLHILFCCCYRIIMDENIEAQNKQKEEETTNDVEDIVSDSGEANEKTNAANIKEQKYTVRILEVYYHGGGKMRNKEDNKETNTATKNRKNDHDIMRAMEIHIKHNDDQVITSYEANDTSSDHE